MTRPILNGLVIYRENQQKNFAVGVVCLVYFVYYFADTDTKSLIMTREHSMRPLYVQVVGRRKKSFINKILD